jgi:hypothetical protein
MTRSEVHRLCSRLGCIFGLLSALLVFVYWVLNPSNMWTGGRPLAIGALMMFGCAAAGVFYVIGKRVKS